ncbi:unnamed protein product [Arabidopsis thaliana]|uniref:Uncharacterized protein n=1 Tax=Arabidopsis thaliana TaxID=3702 RepID=Q9LJ51_ARATH|nr:uncharacterized protein AT3G29796 [Arabidopsis thaliana]AEE77613.1 hypothetical protein AT3G29796 [Arabidopsis thaliana]BAB02994.1 unnamed protein product [Arabidopsis thaliana]|eukprot:NP_189628.1 hypothetical protein AT3G29796 [Arabidopsis thaliana]
MTYTQFPRNCLANVRGKYSSQNLRRNSELVMFPRRDLFVGEEEVCRRDLFVGEEEVCRRDLFVGKFEVCGENNSSSNLSFIRENNSSANLKIYSSAKKRFVREIYSSAKKRFVEEIYSSANLRFVGENNSSANLSFIGQNNLSANLSFIRENNSSANLSSFLAIVSQTCEGNIRRKVCDGIASWSCSFGEIYSSKKRFVREIYSSAKKRFVGEIYSSANLRFVGENNLSANLSFIRENNLSANLSRISYRRKCVAICRGTQFPAKPSQICDVFAGNHWLANLEIYSSAKKRFVGEIYSSTKKRFVGEIYSSANLRFVGENNSSANLSFIGENNSSANLSRISYRRKCVAIYGGTQFPQSPRKFATFLRGIMTSTQFPRNCLANLRGKYLSQSLRLVLFPRRDLFVGEEKPSLICDVFAGNHDFHAVSSQLSHKFVREIFVTKFATEYRLGPVPSQSSRNSVAI